MTDTPEIKTTEPTTPPPGPNQPDIFAQMINDAAATPVKEYSDAKATEPKPGTSGGQGSASAGSAPPPNGAGPQPGGGDPFTGANKYKECRDFAVMIATLGTTFVPPIAAGMSGEPAENFKSDQSAVNQFVEYTTAGLMTLKDPPRMNPWVGMAIYALISFGIPIAVAYEIKCHKAGIDPPKNGLMGLIMSIAAFFHKGATGYKYEKTEVVVDVDHEEVKDPPKPTTPPTQQAEPHRPDITIVPQTSNPDFGKERTAPVSKTMTDAAGTDEASLQTSNNAPGGHWAKIHRVNPILPEVNERRKEAGGQPCIICTENYCEPGKNTCGSKSCNARHGVNMAVIREQNGGKRRGRPKKNIQPK